MIFYVASSTFQQVILTSIKESEQLLIGSECKNDIYLLKYIKENFVTFSSLETIIIDLSAVKDTDEEIVQSFDMLRIMNHETKIIILASNRYEGDDVLTKAFQMSIYNIVVSDDFLEIKNELIYCLKEGMQYKDAIQFKDSKSHEKVVTKTEIKQTVNKVMIGLAGSEKRIGVTHNSIILANFLRKKGFMVALCEYNQSKAFDSICSSFEEKMFDNSYFSQEGVDFYPNIDTDKLGSVLGKSYNFILIDFGTFSSCDRITFNKCDSRFIISGAKPWEAENLNSVFELASLDTLKLYNFYFNFVVNKLRADVKSGMDELENVYFLNYNEDPFTSYDFPDAEIVLADYMPLQLDNNKKRKSLFKKKG